jgi:CubicO group peptidase (beta-lactamase class C family)
VEVSKNEPSIRHYQCSVTKFLFFCFSPLTSAKESSTPSGIPIENMEEFVDEYVQDYIGETTAGAIVVITKDDHILLSKGYGYADIDNKIQMNPRTSYFNRRDPGFFLKQNKSL